MEDQHLIPADTFCQSYQIEISFIRSLEDYGMVNMTTMDGKYFIDHNQLADLEKMIRMHYELGINLEGIDVVLHLLKKLETEQHERMLLRNRLRFYEPPDAPEALL